MYPNDQHKQVFMDLAQYTRAIISQRLVRGREGERVAAVEIMLNTPHISDLMLKGDISGVKEAFKNTNEPGMQCFDDALLSLYKDGKVEGVMEEWSPDADGGRPVETSLNDISSAMVGLQQPQTCDIRRCETLPEIFTFFAFCLLSSTTGVSRRGSSKFRGKRSLPGRSNCQCGPECQCRRMWR